MQRGGRPSCSRPGRVGAGRGADGGRGCSPSASLRALCEENNGLLPRSAPDVESLPRLARPSDPSEAPPRRRAGRVHGLPRRLGAGARDIRRAGGGRPGLPRARPPAEVGARIPGRHAGELGRRHPPVPRRAGRLRRPLRRARRLPGGGRGPARLRAHGPGPRRRRSRGVRRRRGRTAPLRGARRAAGLAPPGGRPGLAGPPGAGLLPGDRLEPDGAGAPSSHRHPPPPRHRTRGRGRRRAVPARGRARRGPRGGRGTPGRGRPHRRHERGPPRAHGRYRRHHPGRAGPRRHLRHQGRARRPGRPRHGQDGRGPAPGRLPVLLRAHPPGALGRAAGGPLADLPALRGAGAALPGRDGRGVHHDRGPGPRGARPRRRGPPGPRDQGPGAVGRGAAPGRARPPARAGRAPRDRRGGHRPGAAARGRARGGEPGAPVGPAPQPGARDLRPMAAGAPDGPVRRAHGAGRLGPRHPRLDPRGHPYRPGRAPGDQPVLDAWSACGPARPSWRSWPPS